MTDPCNCHQAKALQSELAELRAAAFQVLAWIDRSTSVGYGAAHRLERALAVGAREAEPEVVESGQCCHCVTSRCELQTGHDGMHRNSDMGLKEWA